MVVFAIHLHESATGICVSPILNPGPRPSPPNPSGLSQSTVFKYPASCIKLVLVIYFTYCNIHVSMLFSHIVPPSLSPTESKSLFFISMSLLLPCIYGHHHHLSKFHIYVSICCIDISLSDLASLCIIGSSFIHFIRTDSNAFFLQLCICPTTS